jgi:hypothetical protein
MLYLLINVRYGVVVIKSIGPYVMSPSNYAVFRCFDNSTNACSRRRYNSQTTVYVPATLQFSDAPNSQRIQKVSACIVHGIGIINFITYISDAALNIEPL